MDVLLATCKIVLQLVQNHIIMSWFTNCHNNGFDRCTCVLCLTCCSKEYYRYIQHHIIVKSRACTCQVSYTSYDLLLKMLMRT